MKEKNSTKEVIELEDDEINNIFGAAQQSDTTGQLQAVKELNSPDNILMKTQVNEGLAESHYFSKLLLLAQILEWPELKDYCEFVFKTRVSAGRQGRRESVEICRNPVTPEEKQKGFMRRLLQ